MKIEKTSIFGAYLIENEIFSDSRGSFCEVWNKKKFNLKINEDINFVQENWSHSKKMLLEDCIIK